MGTRLQHALLITISCCSIDLNIFASVATGTRTDANSSPPKRQERPRLPQKPAGELSCAFLFAFDEFS